MSKKIICLVCIFVLILLGTLVLLLLPNTINSNVFITLTSSTQNTVQPLITKIQLPHMPIDVFTSSEIPNSVFERMLGNSIPDKGTVDIQTLSYLQITYWGFDDKAHIGEMVVHKEVAQEVLDIFQEVYEQKYPIEKIQLIDEYGADDGKSMADNNTSSFCYRTVANTQKMSKHSFGKAIDINPLYNPYVVGDYISPANGKEYANRSITRKGTIQKGDALYNAFIKRGWTWGGNWNTQKDYQHFQK